MSEAVAKLLPALFELQADERREVIAALAATLPDEDEGEEHLTPEEWEEAWGDEIDRRVADADARKTVGVPADEFMRRMKEKHG